jgi:hypothetical protein
MGAEEIMQAYKNNQTASAIMMGVGAAFPPVGLFGAWATNREKNKITARMQELGLEVPKDEGIFGNVISGIKNLFGMDQQAATAATARGAGTGAGAGTTAGTARAVTPTVTSRVATRPEGPAGGMPAAKPKGRFDTPVGGGMPAAKPKPKAASAPVGGRGTGATAEKGTASASSRGTTALEGPEATRNATQKVLDAAVARSLKAGKSTDEIVNEGVKILEEAARVESAIKDQKNRGMQRGYNKGGLAARTK